MTKTTGNFTDFVSFSRASGGTALRRISYGNELVTNGTFDTGISGWTAFLSTISWVSGKIRVQASTTGISARVADQLMTGLTVGKVYHLVGSVVAQNNFGASNGNASLSIRNTANSLTIASSALPNNTLGDISLSFVATETSQIVRLRWDGDVATTDASFDYDNISVKEVLFDRADGTLQLFNHPTNVPRVEYDASGNRKGLLIEEARTNLLLRSEDVSNASWIKGGGVTVGTPVQVAGISLDNIINIGTSNFRSIWQPFGAVANGGTVTFSCYIKSGTAPETAIRIDDVGTGATSNRVTVPINWAGGVPTLGTPVLLGLTHVGANISLVDSTGVYRVSLTVQNNTGASLNLFAVYYVTWDGPIAAEDTYAGGFQTEVGAFPTSYIPTSGATATRAADICSIATSAFGYNQKAGTIVVDVAEFKFGTSGYPRAFELGNSSYSDDRINVVVEAASGNYSVGLYTASSFQMGGALVSSISSPFFPRKAALAYKTNDGASAYDGGIKATDATIDVSGTTYPRNTLKIGGGTTSATAQINGHIKSIRYYPRRLSNAQIQALTA